MKHPFRASLLAATLMSSGLVMIGVAPPAAAQTGDVSFDSFHDALGPYGDWVYSDRWGEVWIPDTDSDFRPYFTDGRWVYTDDYGWFWESDLPWGDIAFHYGRWVNDPDDGWLWIPGYVWGPGWVIWRSNDRYTGWMPMPPDDAFLADTDTGPSVSITLNFGNEDDDYGYRRWYGNNYNENSFALNWTFVQTRDLPDRSYRNHTVERPQVINIIHNTKNITNYTVVNNFVVNRSVDAGAVERAGGHRVAPVRAAAVIKRPELITSLAIGRSVQLRMRTTLPRGTGLANSAPAPSAAVVQTLSTRVAPRGRKAPVHLYTRETITKAPLKPSAATLPPKMGPATNSMAAPSGTAAPGAEVHGHAGPPPSGTTKTVPESHGQTGPALAPSGAQPEVQHEHRGRTETPATPPASNSSQTPPTESYQPAKPVGPAAITAPPPAAETLPPPKHPREMGKPPVVTTPPSPGTETTPPKRQLEMEKPPVVKTPPSPGAETTPPKRQLEMEKPPVVKTPPSTAVERRPVEPATPPRVEEHKAPPHAAEEDKTNKKKKDEPGAPEPQ